MATDNDYFEGEEINKLANKAQSKKIVNDHTKLGVSLIENETTYDKESFVPRTNMTFQYNFILSKELMQDLRFAGIFDPESEFTTLLVEEFKLKLLEYISK